MPTEPRLVHGSAASAAYDADIIILAFGRFSETLQAVASARCQRGAACHVWVLDQGSSPNIRAAFTEAFHGLAGLSYYEAPINLGVGGGRNFLSDLGRGRIIVALDNDAVFADPGVVGRALASFARDPSLGATGFKILARDGVSLDRFSWGYPNRLLAQRDAAFDAVTFVGAGHAIRRAAWAAAGGYDPALFFTWEEYDFCLKAIAQGWRINYDGSLAVIHQVAPEARVTWSAHRTRYFVRNRLLIARRWNASWPALIPRMAGYLLRALRERRLRPTLRGFLDAIRLDRAQQHRQMPAELRSYLARNDGSHRGPPLVQLQAELLREPMTEP